MTTLMIQDFRRRINSNNSCSKVKAKLNSKALKKPPIIKPLTMLAANKMMSALITKVNKP